MRRTRLLLLLPLLLAPGPAAAETVSGSGALALAALVGTVSPLLSGFDKGVLAQLLDGRDKFSFAAGKTIKVQAGKLTCKASNVDLTLHSCELTFSQQSAMLTGRAAHELFATLIEVGVPPDGAAGSVFAAVADLDCTVDPNEVAQKSGGGATCQYAPPN